MKTRPDYFFLPKQILAVLLLIFSISAFAVDTDGDGVDDSVDAFPNNAAASVDSDHDGYPDSWNEPLAQTLYGCAANAPTCNGLTLDAFPNDACAAVDVDKDGIPDYLLSSCIESFENGIPAAWIETNGLQEGVPIIVTGGHTGNYAVDVAGAGSLYYSGYNGQLGVTGNFSSPTTISFYYKTVTSPTDASFFIDGQ